MWTSSPKVTSSSRRYGASFAGASAIEEGPHAVDDGGELRFCDSREHREREALPRQRLGDREVASPVAEVRVRLGQMHGVRVVAPDTDTTLTKEQRQRPRVGRAHDV